MLTHEAQAWIRGRTKQTGSFRFALWACVCLLSLAGCASPGTANTSATKLAERLQCLGPSVSRGEATLAAETAHAYSLQLAKEYRVVRPAILHNVLVNLGLRQRGLCFQWADDLSAKLQSLNLETLQLHRGVACLETRREHSSVVLTAPQQTFDNGVVLDAWRHSGRLYWGDVTTDKYPWIKVEVIPEGESQTPASAGGAP